ncbi:MAG: hypothetical protein KatS3mg102_1394 [Planctomycetota bacterium]|nr:MAG: hypothetical protein KatS3mg102_1394 [Planctomycetota bacterium]
MSALACGPGRAPAGADRHAPARHEADWWGALAAVALALASLGLYLAHNDFPVWFHADEPKKARFVLEGTHDFYHPRLMIRLAEPLAALLGCRTPQQAARLGRSLVAVLGALSVLVLYGLARRTLPQGWAVFAAAVYALSPIQLVHAHYFKEDVPFTLFALLALWALLRLVERPAPVRALGLGLAAGLALGTHYKGVLLAPLAALAIPLAPRGRRRGLLALLAAALLVAGLVFLGINFAGPGTAGLDQLGRGVLADARNVVHGDRVALWPSAYYGGFHLVHSLVPGMGAPTALAAVLAAAALALRWRRAVAVDRLWLLWLALSYGAIELSPFKPFPDFMRYALPCVPALGYLLARGLALLHARLAQWRPLRAVPVLTALVLLGLTSSMAVRDLVHMDEDTRLRARALRERLPGAAVHGHLSWAAPFASSIAEVPRERLRALGVRWVVVSSFEYERYLIARRLPGQHPSVYARARGFEQLFRRPYLEVRPGYRSIGFHNPTVRLIDLGAGAAEGARR